eukprot:TRINITY_DN16973_c0_g1_i1.p1 TRINITY_DN16973_c0_g1~~TRINITY_DN16973_c0_g1_i1.p1  ORF type:complete len:815 (+),score=145.03 TRINITY_DN16973_c0_g1_i1:131-2446(+)
MSRLTEEALIQRKKEFAGEIESLVEALESVSNDAGPNTAVVTEISAAVEKSQQVLNDLEHAIDSFRSARAEGRRFTEDELAMFRYFGFQPEGRDASPSERSLRETETNVYDQYDVRPSPEPFNEGGEGASEKSLLNKVGANYEALIQTEVEARLATLLNSAEAELQVRSDTLIRDRLRQLEDVMSGAKGLPVKEGDANEPHLASTSMATQTEDDVVDLFGIDSADLLESKINDLVNHRVKMEVDRRTLESGDVQLLRADVEEKKRQCVAFQEENSALKQRIAELEAERQAAEEEKLAQIGRDLPESLEKLRELARDLDEASKQKVHSVQDTGQVRFESLQTLQELMQSSQTQELTRYKNHLKKTKDAYRRQISDLGGQLESVVNDGSEYLGVFQESSSAMQRIVSELSEKKFDYNPPEDRNPAVSDALDAHVARTLSAVRCPVPIDCHKVGPSEYFFDRRLALKLVNDVVFIVRKNTTERLSDYITKLYAPFIQLLEHQQLSTPHAGPLRVLSQGQDSAEKPELDASGMNELHRLRDQQQELMQLLHHSEKKPREGSRSLSPQQPREKSYAARHSQQQSRRSSSNPAGAHKSSSFPQEEVSVIVRFFEMTDRTNVGLVTKREMLRTLKRHPEVRATLGNILLLPHDGALEHVVGAIPGGDAREIAWETLLAIFKEIKQQQKQQVYHESLARAPKREVARAFNDRLQARQREITRDVLDGGASGQRHSTEGRSRSSSIPRRKVSANEKLDVLKAQALREQVHEMRKKQAFGL